MPEAVMEETTEQQLPLDAPPPNEPAPPPEPVTLVRIDRDDCQALQAACGDDEGRKVLQHFALRSGIAEATNGHVLVRIPLRDEGYHDAVTHHPLWLIHRDALALVKAKCALQVDLQTGEVSVVGPGESYPASIPGALLEDEETRWPDTHQVWPKDPGEQGRRVKMGASVWQALGKIMGSSGWLEFVLPPHSKAGPDEPDHVMTAITFSRESGEHPRTGLAMPMRVLE